ncbi:hypothetical protein HG535_0D01220 [Zygotorulaspora mrakii]|uniref:Protein farnesyltransferase subunit beta n=1 Tax=Zygotorulaspora mrakii TaxID=42260 RepID=A0A7H9B203_ZYGMR|nr:uncharacterized protein HG535_0D01220 [Zygotorulaspora mrakii]QLG72414.1 hypothetical protein HG535_0D01220 [Zygotorulaspora mrakii]
MPNSLSRLKFINKNLLGRKRPTIISVVKDEEKDQETIMSIMKEVETDTTIAYNEVLEKCNEQYRSKVNPVLNKDFHQMYIEGWFSHDLPPQMSALDASQPWMLYWLANSMKVLNKNGLTDEIKERIAEKVFAISPQGGPFGGGVGQLPHLASNYAAINALALCDNIGGCWDKLNLKAIYEWLMSLKQVDGCFKTCSGIGETDTRGVYCALSVASMLGIMTPELCEGVEDFLISCQNYEGGFGGCAHEDEAHGGYTFCAIASLSILAAIDRIDTSKLALWCSQRQDNAEKGFCGRSNKLVDGCYSFWIGSTASILEWHGCAECVNKEALKEYILYCCQSSKRPGLQDKPGTNPDFYHTNYVLLGLAIAENAVFITSKEGDNKSKEQVLIEEPSSATHFNSPSCLTAINPIYGLPVEELFNFSTHFRHKKSSCSS